MAPPLSPQAQQKIAAAYKQFHAQVKKISQTHRQTVSTLTLQLDQKRVDSIKKKIGI